MNRKSLITSVKKPLKWVSLLMPIVLILSACASATPTPVPAATAVPQPTTAPVATTAPTAAPATAAPVEATINVATDPKLGQILVDGKGMTLYMYTKDGPNQTVCTGQCLKFWPALITQGNPTLGPGVDASLVGSTAMADGSKIVTYNKMPLYYFAKDTKPGDTVGQDNQKVWYVVSPDGKPVGYTPQAAVTPTTAAPAEATINVATDPKLGQILVDGKGMTLYMYTKDGPNQTNCTPQCLKFWPALITQGNPTLGPGVDASLVGSAPMADGSKILTYNKMPLYYFAKDTKPGDTTGQGNQSVWYVVDPAGNPVGK
jgi:predicted lipoprotein with Yx(FWY)xxD motif